MTDTIRFAMPKGRMQDGVAALMRGAGIRMSVDPRGYRPKLSLAGYETKILKPQNIVEMLHVGSRDVGFAGADWVAEKGAELVELLDTKLNPVQVVAAAPKALLARGGGKLPGGHLLIASEYATLTQRWIDSEGLDATLVRTYGATEVFPPEDADCIVDNTATGSTLRANQLDIIATLMTSSTRLYASRPAMANPAKRARLEHLVMLLSSVLEARDRAIIEVNVGASALDQVIAILPCMKQPTIASLHGEDGYALKSAVPVSALPTLIPELKAHGATDIIVTRPSQIVP